MPHTAHIHKIPNHPCSTHTGTRTWTTQYVVHVCAHLHGAHIVLLMHTHAYIHTLNVLHRAHTHTHTIYTVLYHTYICYLILTICTACTYLLQNIHVLVVFGITHSKHTISTYKCTTYTQHRTYHPARTYFIPLPRLIPSSNTHYH